MLRRRWGVAALGIVSVATAAFGASGVACLALIVLVALALTPAARRRGRLLSDLLGWLPIGACIALALVIAVAIMSGFVGFGLWSSTHARITWTVFVAVVSVVALLRGGRVRIATRWSALGWLLALPMAIMEIARFGQPIRVWSQRVWQETDWIGHGEHLSYLRQAGDLNYSLPFPPAPEQTYIYPRGLHALLAWVIEAGPSASSSSQWWNQNVLALSLAAVLITALAWASAAMLAMLFARWLGAPSWVMVVAPIAMVTALAYPEPFLVMQWAGFVTTAAMAVLLYALALVADGPRNGWYIARLCLAIGLLVVAVHLWQLMVLPVSLVVVYLSLRWWRQGTHGIAVVVVLAVTGVAVSAPMVMASISPTARAQLTAPGGFPSVPLWLTVVICAVVIGAVIVRWRKRPDHDAAFALATAVAATLAIGLVLLFTANGGLDAIPYYPGKVLWHATFLALPAALAAVGLVADRTWIAVARRVRVSGHTPLAVLIVAGPVLLLVAVVGGSVAVNLPTVATWVTQADSQATAPLTVVLDAPGLTPNRAAVVWQLDPVDEFHLGPSWDWHATQILRSMGHPVPAAAPGGNAETVICGWLQEHPDAVRIMGPAANPAELVTQGCPAEVIRPAEWQVVGPQRRNLGPKSEA